MIVASVSYGNDSIALVQWLHERRMLERGPVLCAYCDTGWGSKEWPARVERGEALARSYGFVPHRIVSMGLVPLARLKKAWPRDGMKFCTTELKRLPFNAWAATLDPAAEATIALGVRREESAKRSLWPEWVYESEPHGGRDVWSPLALVGEAERDGLIRRAGLEVLPHRSRECWPCVGANREDLRALTEERVAEIEGFEAEMGVTSNGKERTLFRPAAHMGAVGIREVVAWARSARGKYTPGQGELFGACDSGFCGG